MKLQMHNPRSDCPINLGLEIFGDRWSLLIIRDMIFGYKTTYNEFLASDEKIATNILSSRLKMLEGWGLIEKESDPIKKTRHRYLLTKAGLDLIPMLVEIMLWSDSYRQVPNSYSVIISAAHHNRPELIKQLRENAKRNAQATV